MSTEQKNDPETSLLAEKLTTGWAQFKQGKLIGYRWMALILLTVTGIGLYLYIRAERAIGESKTWYDLEGRNTLSSLKDFAKDNPNSMSGKVAEFHIARVLLGPDGITKISEATDDAQRKKAVENVEEARDDFNKLVDQFKDDPILRAECYLGLAKAEAALIGITKEGSLDFRGSIKALIGYLDKLAEVADGTPWGEEAKKLADSLKASPSPIAEEIPRVQLNLYKMDPRLAPGSGLLPPVGPGPPGGRIPGLPGESGIHGGPIAPSGSPPPPIIPTPAPKSGTSFVPAGTPDSPPGPIPPPGLTAPSPPSSPPLGPVPPSSIIPTVPVPTPGGPSAPVPPPGGPPGPIAPGATPPGPGPIAPGATPPGPGPTPPGATPPGPVAPPSSPPVPPKK